MPNETTKICDCCGREAIAVGDAKNTYMCQRSGLACRVTEVCGDCLGTQQVSVDAEDGEGHSMRGVGTQRCGACAVKRDDDGEI